MNIYNHFYDNHDNPDSYDNPDNPDNPDRAWMEGSNEIKDILLTDFIEVTSLIHSPSHHIISAYIYIINLFIIIIYIYNIPMMMMMMMVHVQVLAGYIVKPRYVKALLYDLTQC